MSFATDCQDGAISHLNLCLRKFSLSGPEVDQRKADEDAEEVFDDSTTNRPAFRNKTKEGMLNCKTRPNGERKLPKNDLKDKIRRDKNILRTGLSSDLLVNGSPVTSSNPSIMGRLYDILYTRPEGR